MSLMFNSINPTVKESWFNEYDWLNFYWYAEEAKPPNMTEVRVYDVTVSCFVYANHDVNQVDRIIQTGILIFLNRSPIHRYIKQQPYVEAIMCCAVFCSMKVLVEMIKSLRYKLRMFGVLIGCTSNM